MPKFNLLNEPLTRDFFRNKSLINIVSWIDKKSMFILWDYVFSVREEEKFILEVKKNKNSEQVLHDLFQLQKKEDLERAVGSLELLGQESKAVSTKDLFRNHFITQILMTPSHRFDSNGYNFVKKGFVCALFIRVYEDKHYWKLVQAFIVLGRETFWNMKPLTNLLKFFSIYQEKRNLDQNWEMTQEILNFFFNSYFFGPLKVIHDREDKNYLLYRLAEKKVAGTVTEFDEKVYACLLDHDFFDHYPELKRQNEERAKIKEEQEQIRKRKLEAAEALCSLKCLKKV